MSIKLETIYNYGGGGGGGYKDGGQLIDAEFIKVENNTISTYDNTARDPVNFYFEVSDGEMLNSIIELTTAVNATINVCLVKDGFYYLLGNIGGNTVNAGNDYKITITGHSFAIENVSGLSNDFYINIDGSLVKVVKIGTQYWTDYVKYSCSDYRDKIAFGKSIRYYKFSCIRNFGDFRVPTVDDANKFISFVGANIDGIKSTSNWHNDWNGTNELGFNAEPIANLKSSGEFPLSDGLGYYQNIWVNYKEPEGVEGQLNVTYNSQLRILYQLPYEYCAIKLVADV